MIAMWTGNGSHQGLLLDLSLSLRKVDLLYLILADLSMLFLKAVDDVL